LITLPAGGTGDEVDSFAFPFFIVGLSFPPLPFFSPAAAFFLAASSAASARLSASSWASRAATSADS